MMASLILLASGVFLVRSRANEAIRISEARLKRAEFASKSGNWELNLKSQVITASEGAAVIYGITKGQLEYSVAKEIPLPEYRPFLDDSLKRLIEEDLHYDIEFKIKTADTGEIKDIHSVAFYDREKGVLFGIIQDITERRRTQDALRESEEKWRKLVQTIPDYVALFDRDGKYLFLNHFAEGFSIKDIEGKSYTDLLADDSKACYQQAFEAAKRTGNTQYVEHDALGDNWTIKRYESYFVPIIENNQFENMMVIARDITERKRTQEAIKENDAIFNQFMEHSPIYIFFKDENIRSLRLSRNFEQMLGKNLEELLGKTMDELFPSELARNMIEDDLRILRDGVKIEVEEEFNNRLFSTIKFPIEVDGKPKFLAGYTIDITERKQAEEEILKSKQQYDNLVSKIPVGVYILRSKPDGAFGLEYASPRMAEMLGLSVEDLLAHGEAILKAIHPADQGGFLKLNRDGIEFGRPFDWKGRVIVKGEVKWLHVSSLPQLMESGDTLWHGLIVDITERVRDEAEIKLKNEELTNLNATKDKFFSIIAHDLKSPFNSIIGFSGLLSRQIQEKDFAGIEKYAGIIQNSSQQAMDLLMNLLEWSRSQTGRIVFTPENIDLSALINQSIEFFYGSAQQKSITIYAEIAVTRSLYADKAMINTILRNLISNAIKFTKTGGEIIVSAEQIPHEIVVTVSDNGVGMDTGSIAKLFRIDQNHSTLGTEKEKGTGLGLLLCSEFVEKHGGRIWVESTPGKGSKFSFTIPETKIPNTSS